MPWYALLVIGFLKETVIPFLGVTTSWLVAPRLFSAKSRRERIRASWRYGMVALSVVLPLVVYLAYRSIFGTFRGFTPGSTNLLDVEVYSILLRSYAEQFGPALALMVLGWLVLARESRFRTLAFMATAFFADAVFHVLDNARFVGYSRFDLFLLPLVITGAAVMICALSSRSRSWTTLALASILVFNLFMLSVNADGSKQPYWGEYRAEVSEHYYPYREAISWLAQRYPGECVTFVAGSYGHFAGFYMERFAREACFDVKTIGADEDDGSAIERVLREAETEGRKLVMYPVTGEAINTLPAAAGFRVERSFANDAHLLLLFSSLPRSS